MPFAADNVQPFELLRHTREVGRFSGTTVRAGETYGVLGVRGRPRLRLEEMPVLDLPVPRWLS